VFTMARCRGVCTVSLYAVHNADGLVLIGKELVVFPLTDGWALWSAGMRRGAGVHSMAINSTMKTEGRLFTFPLMWKFLIWGITCG